MPGGHGRGAARGSPGASGSRFNRRRTPAAASTAGRSRITPEHGQPAQVPRRVPRLRRARSTRSIFPSARGATRSASPGTATTRQPRAWNDRWPSGACGRLRDYGFTTFLAACPRSRYLGFKDGKPELDFTEGDRQMELARQLGFTMPVITYGGVSRPGPVPQGRRRRCRPPASAITASSSRPSSRRSRSMPTRPAGCPSTGTWATSRSATIWSARPRMPKPTAPPSPRGRRCSPRATSFEPARTDDPHFRFAKALHVANLNGHNEPTVELLHDGGRRLGLLQRRQPLDLRRLHVQGRQAVRHEVPPELALERRGRRPLLRRSTAAKTTTPGATPTPDGHLDPVGRVRARHARGTGRLSLPCSRWPAWLTRSTTRRAKP